MILLKKERIQLLICAAVLVIFAIIHYHYLKTCYEEVIDSTGLIFENFDEKLKEENERVLQTEEEYQKMIGLETESESAEDILDEQRQIRIKTLDLRAISALLLDASNNRVLYEENGYQEMPMASTTKIMTCIVTLENGNLQDVVTVSSYAARQPDVQLNINTGEQYYLKDLLYSLMLESHNDVAVAIAEHVGGSVEGFATMMNDKARELGCDHTNFVTPNGLDAKGHYTTARDLAVIASYAIKNEHFIKITNSANHHFKEIKKGRSFSVSNKNRFLYMMDGAIGVKTGFTGGAGYCFVGAIKRSDRTLVSVVLGCGWPPNKSLKWSDTKKLMNYGINHFKVRQIFENVKLQPVFVHDGQKKLVPLKVEESNLELLMRDDERVTIEYDIPKVLEAPIVAESIVGHAKYYIDKKLFYIIPIYTTESIDKIDFEFCLRKLLRIWSLQ